MSNVNTAAAAPSAKMKGKISVADFRGQRILGMDPSVQEVTCGTLIGRATGLLEKVGPTGEVFQGYTGNFEFVDSDAKVPGTKSGVLYLPGGINEMVLDAVNGANGGEVVFVLEVVSERSGNAAGRTWSFRDLRPAEAIDPMAELRKFLPGYQAPAAIENKGGEADAVATHDAKGAKK